jgi:hypothetical protein
MAKKKLKEILTAKYKMSEKEAQSFWLSIMSHMANPTDKAVLIFKAETTSKEDVMVHIFLEDFKNISTSN